MVAGPASRRPAKFDKALTLSNLPQFFDLAYTSVNAVSTAAATSLAASLSGVQTPQEWLTEIGLSLNANGDEKTFANVLANGVQALLLATAMPDTTQAEFWSSFGAENAYAYQADPLSPNQQTTVTLTPDGQVMTWVDKAAQGATAMTPQVGTVVPGGVPYQQMSTANPLGKLNSVTDTTRKTSTTSAATGLQLAPYSITIIN